MDTTKHTATDVATLEERLLALDERLERIEALTRLSAKTVFLSEDAALFLGYSLDTIHRLTSARQIPHFKKNHRLYFKREELEAWALEKRVKTQAHQESDVALYLRSRHAGASPLASRLG